MNSTPVLIGAILLFSACNSVQEQSPTSPVVQTSELSYRMLTDFGEHRIGNTSVKVDSDKRNLVVNFFPNLPKPDPKSTARTEVSPAGWTAHDGWFVWMQDNQVWAYDGKENLHLVTRTFDGVKSVISHHGPRQYPIEIPAIVITGLKESYRSQLQPAK